MPYITYADIEPLTKQTDGCSNNPENILYIVEKIVR